MFNKQKAETLVALAKLEFDAGYNSMGQVTREHVKRKNRSVNLKGIGMIKNTFEYIHKISLFAAILCLLPICTFAMEQSVKENQCTYSTYFPFGERLGDNVELCCFNGDEIKLVKIDYGREQCVHFVVADSGEIKEQEMLGWTDDCQKYKERATSAETLVMNFPDTFKIEKIKLKGKCRKLNDFKPYSDFVANPSYSVYVTATRLEEAGNLPEALEIFQLAEQCCADEDLPLVRNHITILEEWLSKTEADLTIIKKYLLEENASPPMDIIPMFRLVSPEDYRLARDVFLILYARSRADIDGLLTSRIDYKDKSLTKLQADGKQVIWVGLAMSYLCEKENEDKALQIIKVQLGFTKPADQFAALAELYEDLSEGNTKQGENRSLAIINLQKSLALQWDRRNADKLFRLLKADKRIDEVVDLWRQILMHDNHNIDLKCSFIRFLLRYDRKDEAIVATRELDVKNGAEFRLIVPELLEHELYEETVRFMQRAFMSNQFYFADATVFCLANLAKALHHTGDKRGAVAALRDAESFARYNAMEEYQHLMDATKEIGQQSETEKIGKTIDDLEQPAFTFVDPEQKKNPVTELITGMEFVWVPEGCYQMGYLRDYGDADDDERPAHTICVDGFYLGKHEVTQEQYEKVMGINPSRENGANLPVDSVSWDGAQEFIREFANLSGRRFRLPTEAEWEYAARSARGWRNEKYSGGNDYREVAWSYHNSDNKPHPVGKKQPNDLGIFDMTGNVNEWCQGFYNESYYQNSPRVNPQGASAGTHRVYRGGAWNEVDDQIEITNRRRSEPTQHLANLGFRLVLLSGQEE